MKEAIVHTVYRQDIYELPVRSIREIITNAVLHRSYLDPASIQVCIYDDRLEIDSPGMLYAGLSVSEALSGKSKCRNKAIAEAFQYMNLIEGWGTGLPRLFEACKEMNLPEPEFTESGDGIKVTIYRAKGDTQIGSGGPNNESNESNSDTNTNRKTGEKTNTNKKTGNKTDEKTGRKDMPRTETEKTLIRLIDAKPEITISELAEKTGLSNSGIRYVIAQLRKKGLLEREGSRKQGRWIVRQ